MSLVFVARSTYETIEVINYLCLPKHKTGVIISYKQQQQKKKKNTKQRNYGTELNLMNPKLPYHTQKVMVHQRRPSEVM